MSRSYLTSCGSPHVYPLIVTLDFELCDCPERFRELTEKLARHPTLWIDTEVADWFTPLPRLSLVQVRGADGRLYVIDLLAPGMTAVLNEAFIPGVMASPSVQKWAHSASYERRFLGGDSVENLACTLQLARSVPYHRLPVSSFSLASLARHLLGEYVDKTPQGSDWGLRPLRPDQLLYAAADPEWCFRLQERLTDLLVHIDPSAEDPPALQARYIELLLPLAAADAERKALRAAVQAFMEEAGRVRFGGFTLHQRIARKTTLAELVALAVRADPGRRYDLTFSMSQKLRNAIGTDACARLQPSCRVTVGRSFRGPRLERGDRPAAGTYVVRPDDPTSADRDFAGIDHRRRLLQSEREELRDRMKCWLTWKQLDGWGQFSFSAPQERWAGDIRDLAGLLPAEPYETGLPQRFLLAFPPAALEELNPLTSRSAVLYWHHPREVHRVDDVQLSRDWHEAAAEEEGATASASP
jgi:ribonuclease D